MPDITSSENEFIKKCVEIVEKNIGNEQFGVSELAAEIGMSRSNLLRKIKKLTNLSVSQFIRQIRLEAAMELLQQEAYTVSEIGFKVGFSSNSYFIKCFHDHYGYPPGEATKRKTEPEPKIKESTSGKKRRNLIAGITILFICLAAVLYVFFHSASQQNMPEKSIAVLPFMNDSNDSTNVHIINGLMESTLNNLQKIKDLRVISRTSVGKFRNSSLSIPEIAKALDVSYFVEGSGQKIGDRILLNIQLIEARSGRYLWAEQYSRNTKDIFQLQSEVAKNIAEQIQVIVTPEEAERIEEIPTSNLVAYDLFLKGQEFFNKGTGNGLEQAIPYFKQAIEHDDKFALAYADIAISYYYLDVLLADKKYQEEINSYADKAVMLDATLPQSMVAKALFYMNNGEYKMALPYFEKALEYNPNSALVLNFLSDLYARYLPNTEKYLEHALKGLRIDVVKNDSADASFSYLHLSNAFIQSGFVNEAEKYIHKSLEFNPDNLFSQYVKAYILFAKNKNLEALCDGLLTTLKKDTTRLDILQEVAKSYYYLRDNETSFKFYRKFVDAKKAYNLRIYPGEDAKIALVFSKMGQQKEADELMEAFKLYADNDQSIYKNLSLTVYYSLKNEKEKAIGHLKLFAKEDHYQYWIPLFLEIDPLVDNIKNLAEFKSTMKEIKDKFEDYHRQIKNSLKEKKLI